MKKLKALSQKLIFLSAILLITLIIFISDAKLVHIMFSKFIICITSLIMIFVSFKENYMNRAIFFILVSVIYNPIIKIINITKKVDDWMLISIITTAILIYIYFSVSKSEYNVKNTLSVRR